MKRSLFKQFSAIMILPILLIFVASYFIQLNIQKSHLAELIDYGSTTLENININISLLSENMSKGASIFANSEYAQILMASDSGSAKNLARKNLSDTISLSKNYNSSLVDILLCNSKGTTSLAGYISLNLEKYIETYTINAKNINRAYTTYIDPGSQKTYLIHFTPIYATKITANYRKQLGYVVIVSTLKTVSTLINSSTDIYMELVDTNNNEILISNRENFKGSSISNDVSHQVTKNVSNSNLLLRGTVQLNSAADTTSTFEYFLIFALIFYVLFVFYIFLAVDVVLIRPINSLNKQIKNINFANKQIKHTAKNEIGSIAAHINEMLDKISNLNQKNIESQARLYEMEISKKQTQIYAYQSQINPHFLYNMLQCMRGISLLNGMKEIANICTYMADLFRYSIKGQSYVVLKEELDIINKYLYMISVRFQNKITHKIFIDDALLDCRIPKMILQPIVENAIFHGLEKMAADGALEIYAYKFGSDLKIEVHDNGVGIPKEQQDLIVKCLKEGNQKDFNANISEEKGIGLININNKIKLFEGDKCGLEVDSVEGSTTVIVTLKYQE